MLSQKYIGSITYFSKLRKVLTLPTWAKLFWSKLPKGYCSCIGIFNAHALPLSGYPINHLGFITYLLKLARVLHNHTKSLKVVLASYYNNILNHETKGFLKNIYSMLNITCPTY
jgi:hypothetical protein